jgi:hypothetical protein
MGCQGFSKPITNEGNDGVVIRISLCARNCVIFLQFGKLKNSWFFVSFKEPTNDIW